MCWQRYRRPQKSGDVFFSERTAPNIYTILFFLVLFCFLWLIPQTVSSDWLMYRVQVVKRRICFKIYLWTFFPCCFSFLPDPPTPLSPNGQFYLQNKTTGQKPQTTYLITALSFTTEKLSALHCLPWLNYILFLDSEGWCVDSKALN